MKQKLRYQVVTRPRRWTGLLRRMTLARAVQGSNSIEGYNVTVGDAMAVAEGEEPLDADRETRAAVFGYQQAMTYVLQLAEDGEFGFSGDLLRGLHFMMMGYDLSKHPGRWRPGSIFVHDSSTGEVVYEGPPREILCPLIDELVHVLNEPETDNRIVTAAMAHLNLVMIHPFSDGNGRMARCLQSLVLARSGSLAAPFSSIEEYLGRNTRAYYDVLGLVGQGEWHPENDASPWIKFCLVAHYRQAATLLRRTREIERLWVALAEEVAKHGLPERTVDALAAAGMRVQVRNSLYRSLAEISEGVASRDLTALVAAGLLLPHGEKRGRVYSASPRVVEIQKTVREAKPVADPYVEYANRQQPVIPGLGV
jgi:Fic family protein